MYEEQRDTLAAYWIGFYAAQYESSTGKTLDFNLPDEYTEGCRNPEKNCPQEFNSNEVAAYVRGWNTPVVKRAPDNTPMAGG